MELHKIISDVETLTKEQHISLARMIVKEYNIYPDENSNGVFFNLSTLPPIVIKAIQSWLLLVNRQ